MERGASPPPPSFLGTKDHSPPWILMPWNQYLGHSINISIYQYHMFTNSALFMPKLGNEKGGGVSNILLFYVINKLKQKFNYENQYNRTHRLSKK